MDAALHPTVHLAKNVLSANEEKLGTLQTA